MTRKLSALIVGVSICAGGLLSARAQDTKKAEKPEIPGGIVGKITKVDVENESVTILTEEGGKPRTFTVTEETTILGPRGGRVRGRLKNPRFHEGMELTVVATGTTAKELHLGFNRKPAAADSADAPKAVAKKKMTRREREDDEVAKVVTKKAAPAAPAPETKPADSKTAAATTAAATKAAAEDDDDEDDEYPGKVKSYTSNGNRHQLVVALLNGKNGSYLLSKDVKVLVKGKPSKDGLEDKALKEGAPIVVLTEPGSRKVTELHIDPIAPAASKAVSKLKKAG